MIVYNCYLHELFILQNYIFSFRKKKKKQEFAFFTCVFAQKLQENKVYDTKKTQKDDLAKRKVILFIELSHVVQERAEGPKAPSPGHRPGDNGNQQGALKGQKPYK